MNMSIYEAKSLIVTLFQSFAICFREIEIYSHFSHIHNPHKSMLSSV